MTNHRYLMEMTRISAQKISDRIPSTFSGVGAIPVPWWNASRMAYSGLVPMSPYTTPSAARARTYR
jgi:hypothetical protein